MKNQLLIYEMISQTSQIFTSGNFEAIDTLLEKEYIQRVEGTRDTFSYIT